MTKKEHILAASEELFAEFGYDATSIRMIAKKADINIAMVSYYFGSKEMLFTEMVEQRALIFRTKLQDIQKDIEDPIARIDSMIESYIDKVMDNYRFHKILHRQISLQNTDEMSNQIQSILMKNITEVRNIIEDGIRKKVFRQVDVELLIITFFGTVAQFSNSSCLTTRLFDLDNNKHISEYPEMKARMKKYLTDLFKKYLMISNE